jgi:hypothetical protein
MNMTLMEKSRSMFNGARLGHECWIIERGVNQ